MLSTATERTLTLRDSLANWRTQLTQLLIADFADYASARAALVDGRYAMDESGVRILVGAATYAHAAGIYQTGSGASALGRLMPRVSSAHSSSCKHRIQKAIATRSQGRAVAPVWPSISLIRDNVSGSAKRRNTHYRFEPLEFQSFGRKRLYAARVQTFLTDT